MIFFIILILILILILPLFLSSKTNKNQPPTPIKITHFLQSWHRTVPVWNASWKLCVARSG